MTMKNQKKKNLLPTRVWLPLIGAFIFLTACSIGYVRYLAPEEINDLAKTPPVFVELNDGSTMTFVQPRLQDGKLIDMLRQLSPDNKLLRIKEIAISDIKLVKIVKRGNALYSFIPAAIAAAWLIIGEASAPPPPPSESCPFIYSWDGSQYIFEAEPYGGAICRGLQRSEWCRLDWLRGADHLYRIRIANELDETQYTDEVKLLAIDHTPGVRVAADTNGGVHAFASFQAPQSAWDENGRDIRSLVAARDLNFWESECDSEALKQKTNLRHELDFVFPKPPGAKEAKLLVNAWTSSWGAEVPKLFLQSLGYDLGSFFEEVNALGPAWQKLIAWFLTEELYMLRIQVRTTDGWQTRGYIQGGGPFVANDKAYVLDISDVPGDMLELKLCPPVTFWRINYFAVDYSPEPALQIQELSPKRAVSKDGMDVTQQLEAADGDYLIAPQAGDWSEVYFAEPPRRQGLERSFILKINGYYDIHLPTDKKPVPGLPERFLSEPGFTIRYALDAFIETQKQKK